MYNKLYLSYFFLASVFIQIFAALGNISFWPRSAEDIDRLVCTGGCYWGNNIWRYLDKISPANIFRQQTIWDIWTDIDGGVVASIAATFTSNICAEVKLLEKPNIWIYLLVNNKIVFIVCKTINWLCRCQRIMFALARNVFCPVLKQISDNGLGKMCDLHLSFSSQEM